MEASSESHAPCNLHNLQIVLQRLITDQIIFTGFGVRQCYLENEFHLVHLDPHEPARDLEGPHISGGDLKHHITEPAETRTQGIKSHTSGTLPMRP